MPVTRAADISETTTLHVELLLGGSVMTGRPTGGLPGRASSAK